MVTTEPLESVRSNEEALIVVVATTPLMVYVPVEREIVVESNDTSLYAARAASGVERMSRSAMR